MKYSLLLLIVLISFISLSNAKTCRTETKRSCKKVRRAPYFKNVITRKPYTATVKYVKKTRVAYKARVCRTRWKKIAYKIPYRTQIKVKVKKSRKVKKYYYVWQVYYVPEKRKRRVPYQKKYPVKQKKKFLVKTKVKKFKKVWVTRKAICTKAVKQKVPKKIRVPYTSKCPKFIDGIKYVEKWTYVNKNFKKKVWTGKYYASGAKDCWKKKYVWRYFVKKVRVKRKFPVKYKKKIFVKCIKYKLKTITITKTKIVKYQCKKRYPKVVPYFVTVTKVVYKTVTVYKIKTLYKYVYYTIRVKKRRRVKKSKDTIQYYWGYKLIWGFKSKTAYRKVSSVYFTYVTRYRSQYKIATKTVTKYRKTVKKVPVKYYINKCTVTKTKVCK